jgi:hypothetical protein
LGYTPVSKESLVDVIPKHLHQHFMKPLRQQGQLHMTLLVIHLFVFQQAWQRGEGQQRQTAAQKTPSAAAAAMHLVEEDHQQAAAVCTTAHHAA